MEILAVGRAERYSGDAAERDEHLLFSLLYYLRDQGHYLSLVSEEALIDSPFVPTEPDLVVTMARSKEALKTLTAFEKQGIRVVNACRAVESLNHDYDYPTALREAQIPLPATQILRRREKPKLPFPLWVKTFPKENGRRLVKLVRDKAELRQLQTDTAKTHFSYYRVSQPVPGDLYKCYAIADGSFFALRQVPTDSEAGTDAPERDNPPFAGYTFSRTKLQETLNRAAKSIGLDIFGADVVVQPDGSFVLIDLNDFPSFSGFVEEATKAIAQFLTR